MSNPKERHVDKTTFDKLVNISAMASEDEALSAANKLLGIDLTDINAAAKLVNDTLGKGDVGGKVGDGDTPSIATFGAYTAEARTYPVAILKLIVTAVKDMSIDKFLAGKKSAGSKKDAGQGAAPDRSMGLSRY